MSGSVTGKVFSYSLLDSRPGQIIFKVAGADELFLAEAGGHRVQMISPTDKSKRVHTSTITIAVLPESQKVVEFNIPEADLAYQTCRGSGPGGQNRNKRDTAVQLTHLPTGLMVRCEAERNQYQNRVKALEILKEKLLAEQTGVAIATESASRKEQVGSGMRGDKRRTIRHQDGQVIDHIDGRKWRLKEYLRGDWD